MSNENFHVIIVGAGPVGLYMAHAMEKAKIKYTVLEQRPNILNTQGHLLVSWPQTAVDIPMHHKKRIYGGNGSITSVNRFWDDIEVKYDIQVSFHLSDLIRVLYLGLKGKETHVKTSAEVSGIEMLENGVRVHLQNGPAVDGSLVIGADGVYSKSRELMRNLAEDTCKEAMVSNFYGIFGQASAADLRIEPGVLFESRGTGAYIHCLAMGERLQFVALKRHPEPSVNRAKYTKEDIEKFVTSITNVAICPGITFNDVWTRTNKDLSVMVNQEEGFMSRWHYGRIVIVGDSVHKISSYQGLGMTCGLHSAALLANLLQNLVTTTEPQPSVAALSRVSSLYQKERQCEVKPIWNGSYSATREVMRRSWMSWIWDRYILPWIDKEKLFRGIIPSMTLIRHGNILSYVPFVGQQGAIPWVRRPAI
ncbi:hypothetical protein F4805DRAFT_468721 [Annulohypoxylon moriforme]|nr:hypothetical protein F4805DRAFT_468721 [Annulohypoxylon moriforme]